MILIIGAAGQIGTELVPALTRRHGAHKILATDMKAGVHTKLDVTDRDAVTETVLSNKVEQIYLLAAMLSANGEAQPQKAWSLNMNGLLNVLDAARIGGVSRVFWPSSIAVFGEGVPKIDCPQDTVTKPGSVYGISKLAGEGWCRWYSHQYGMDIRSLRYPGLISYTAPPGGGTTDYAVDIFHKAVRGERYTSFLAEDSRLPMMYMPDAVRATIELMDAPPETIRKGQAYNITAMSFTPVELAAAIRKFLPGLEVVYRPDHRQQIANSWPQSIDDSAARYDWGWAPGYDLSAMVSEMLERIKVGVGSVI